MSVRTNIVGTIFIFALLTCATAGSVATLDHARAAETIARMDLTQALAYAVIVLSSTLALVVTIGAGLLYAALKENTKAIQNFNDLMRGGACPVYGPRNRRTEE